MMKRVICFWGVLLLAAALCQAQDITGNITGVVKDSTGAVVPNAQVIAINTATQARFEFTSDSTGTYTARAIPVGVYDLQVSSSGFKKFEATNIRVQVNEFLRVDVTLDVGTATETVTVTGQPIAVDTTTQTIKTVMDQRRIEDLPLNGRNPTQLMRLVAGVVADPRADVTSSTTYPGVTPVSVNGARSNATNYILDGAQNNDHYSNAPSPMPNPDALQEFSVQVNNFSAEFGRQAGGIVNAVTKSGTNELHGSAFEFVRNNALNAANFFSPIVNGKKKDDGLKRNQFGATLGGPVYLPKIYNGRNKTFFFFSYQGTLERRAPVATAIVVPTAAQRIGDFSAASKKPIDPLTGVAYPGNMIPASQISPISQEILKFIPTPTSGNTIFVAPPNNDNDHQVLARGDHQISDKNRISGRFWNSHAAAPGFLNPTDYLENATAHTWLNRSVSVTDTHIFTPTLLNEVSFAFTRTDNLNIPVYPPRTLASLGSNIYNDNMAQWYVGVNGYWGTLNTGDTNSFKRDEYQALDTVRWSHASHQLSVGFEYGRGLDTVVNNFRSNGQFQFNAAAPFTGEAFADFLIGRYYTLTQGAGEYRDTRITRVAAFVQDAWKVTPRFTLDLGARWEPFIPYTDLNGKIAVWHPGQQSTRFTNAPTGVVFAGDNGVPGGGVDHVWTRFGPRVGFAWDLFGNGKTSLRGGYGVFYDNQNTIMMNNQSDQAPYGTVLQTFGSLSNSFADPYAGIVNPFPAPHSNVPANAQYPAFASPYLFAPDYRNAYIQSWNVSLEREIFGGFIARLSYAGSEGHRLTVVRELNAAIFAPNATTANTNQRRPIQPVGSTSIVEPVGNSVYHALQFTTEKRFSRGFSILANYQFSKAIDDSSNSKATGQSRTNPFNQRFDRGPSDFDRTHVFNASGLWELPIHFQSRAVNSLLGGWSLNGIFSAYSGYVFTVTSGADNARTGTGNQRADLVGNPYISGDRTRGQEIAAWLNPAAFQVNAIGTFGTLGRNTFRGPGFASLDAGLFKKFVIHERLSATLRFEAFNALNHPNLMPPSASVTGSNFLKITSAYDPRILQLALRLAW
jgi:outer membrane receptor protein involved in Fe transport